MVKDAISFPTTSWTRGELLRCWVFFTWSSPADIFQRQLFRSSHNPIIQSFRKAFWSRLVPFKRIHRLPPSWAYYLPSKALPGICHKHKQKDRPTCHSFLISNTVEPCILDQIGHLWGLAVAKPMILSTKGSNMTLGRCIGLQHI